MVYLLRISERQKTASKHKHKRQLKNLQNAKILNERISVGKLNVSPSTARNIEQTY